MLYLLHWSIWKFRFLEEFCKARLLFFYYRSSSGQKLVLTRFVEMMMIEEPKSELDISIQSHSILNSHHLAKKKNLNLKGNQTGNHIFFGCWP